MVRLLVVLDLRLELNLLSERHELLAAQPSAGVAGGVLPELLGTGESALEIAVVVVAVLVIVLVVGVIGAVARVASEP